MNSIMDYTCGCCGCAGQAEYDSEFIHKAELWKAKLVCNPCGDFLSAMLRLRACCYESAILFHRAKGQKEEGIIKAELRRKLTTLTHRVSRITAAHWRTSELWDPDFVDQILEQPDKIKAIFTIYQQSVRAASRPQQPEFRPVTNDP